MRENFPYIYVTGVARSGTSWIGQVLNSSHNVVFRFQPFFAYEFKGRVDEDSDAPEFRKVFAAMAATESEFLTQEDKIASGLYPRFEKAGDAETLVMKENRYQSLVPQLVRKVPELGLLAVVRNPCAVLNSWRKNAKEFPPGNDFAKEWRHGMCKNMGPEDCFGYYRWKEAANQYLDLLAQFPQRVFLLRYEDAVHSPSQSFQEVFAFFDLHFGSQSEKFLEQASSEHSANYYSVYKSPSVADSWREELPLSIVDEIHDDLKGTRLDQFLR